MATLSQFNQKIELKGLRDSLATWSVENPDPGNSVEIDKKSQAYG